MARPVRVDALVMRFCKIMEELLTKSKAIYKEAVGKFEPDAVIAMVSGGNDSAVAYHVAKEIGVPIDYIFHLNTGTGIQQTTDFVRKYYGNEEPEYIEPSAGDAYENYVKRKGFIGKGKFAHMIAYHILKAGPLRKAISKHIRKGKRGVKVLLLNGARASESKNRKINLPDVYNADPAQKGNIWVNIIHHWTGNDCRKYLDGHEIPINPVTKEMCRSGECMCGTMQSDEARIEASLLYPEWANWLDELEQEVIKDHPWKWGHGQPKWFKDLKNGQMGIFGEHEKYEDQFQPMCVGCKNE